MSTSNPQNPFQEALKSMHAPHPEELSATLMRVMGQSQKLLADFMERNKKYGLNLPIDPKQINQAFIDLMERIQATPEKAVDAQMAFVQDYTKLMKNALQRWSGEPSDSVIEPAKNDRRFKDSSWQEMWIFDFLKQSYLLSARCARDVVEQSIGDLDPQMARKIDFYTRQTVDALSPSNFWLTNPEVLRTTLESSGENLVKGFENLLNDLERGGGHLAIKMSDNKAFQFGKNIAATPGKVVYQNGLMQLIQYAPSTENVAKAPLLIVPPWINKFYILDLRENNSLIKYMVDQGHTVFCVSWANPNATFANINFDDYMEQGILESLRQIKIVTEAEKVNVLGYCIGGTLLASTIAYLNALDDDKKPQDLPEISSASYLVTMTDFSDPGEISVFMDDEQVKTLEDHMNKIGYLEAPIMSMAFALLRANDLVWSFVINNYLLGKDPFPFDLLTWNSDATNLPAKMQSFYLRNMYLQNNLIKPNALSMKGVPIDIRSITTPSYMLSAREDHIAPWRSTYASTSLYQGPMTFVLAGSGHIAGVINPPASNKYGYWTNNQLLEDPDEWLEKSTAHDGSWWPHWVEWLKDYSDGSSPARTPGGAGEQIIEDAPGSYVRITALGTMM